MNRNPRQNAQAWPQNFSHVRKGDDSLSKNGAGRRLCLPERCDPLIEIGSSPALFSAQFARGRCDRHKFSVDDLIAAVLDFLYFSNNHFVLASSPAKFFQPSDSVWIAVQVKRVSAFGSVLYLMGFYCGTHSALAVKQMDFNAACKFCYLETANETFAVGKKQFLLMTDKRN